MGEGVGMGTRVSSTPGLRSFTPSQRSGPHSAHVGAWYRQTGGSNGNGPSTENNPSFWRLSTDRHCRSPRSGSTGTRMEAALESFTIVTTVTSPALADTHHHRKPAIIDSHRFDDWFDPDSPVPRLVELVREPYTSPYEACPISKGQYRPERRSPHPGALGRSWRSLGRGRKSELTAEIDDYSIVGGIGIKRTSIVGTSQNHSLMFVRLCKINGSCMSVVRERRSREGCKPSIYSC